MPEPTRYILVRWTDGNQQLRQTGEYLAVVSDDGTTATILRVVEPGEVAGLPARIVAVNERHANAPEPKSIEPARAATSSQRRPPAVASSLPGIAAPRVKPPPSLDDL